MDLENLSKVLPVVENVALTGSRVNVNLSLK